MRTRDEIERLIVGFIGEELLAAGAEGVDSDEDLFSSGHVDSVGIVRLIGYLQTELELEIPPTELVPENFRTPRILAAYLERLAVA